MADDTVEIYSSSVEQSRRRKVQNYLLIWADASIDEQNQNCQNILTQLQSVVTDVKLCLSPAQCVQILTDATDEKVFIISSGSLGQDVISKTHDMICVDAIYIFCANKSRHEGWASKWIKIRGVFTSITPICQALKKAVQEFHHNAISISFVPKVTPTADEESKNHLPPSFMYSNLFKEIILKIDDDDDDTHSMNELIKYCAQKRIPKHEIEYLKQNYSDRTPVWWYSCEMFLYGMVNYSLRTLDMEAMTKLGFFIRHLHVQLQELHRQQSDQFNKSFKVYRGQSLRNEDFRELCDTKGGLLSFNCFLSTSKEKIQATSFVNPALIKNDNVAVLFIMTIDHRKKMSVKTPYALIDNYSAIPQEQEILFSMHTVFHVNDVKSSSENEQLWEVQLTLTDDNDSQLAKLTQRMAKELYDTTGWHRMGKLMLQVGHFDQAKELYNRLLSECTNDSDRAHIYHMTGTVKRKQGEYIDAITFYEKSLEIYRQALPEDHAKLAPSYNNIALTYSSIGNYTKALTYYKKAHEIFVKNLPPNHHSLSTSYNNLGQVYKNMGYYSKALEYYKISHNIYKRTLPSNHPSLATSYSNIGRVYQDMGNYLKALEYCEKAHQIYERTLPQSHPDLATSYNNIGGVYNSMGDYSKALKHYEKGLEITEKVLPSMHPSLAISYNNIGRVYQDMGDYSKALEYYNKSDHIYNRALPSNHPSLATSYSNIGRVYQDMGNYLKALEYCEKAHQIYESTLPRDHPDVATSYSNIGGVYNSMGDYAKALEYYKKDLEITEKMLPSNHPSLAISYNNIGRVYQDMGDFSNSLKYYEISHQIREKVLPKNHPSLAGSYLCFGSCHERMGNYEHALSALNNALAIQQQIFRDDNQAFSATYSWFGRVYRSMKDYPRALENFEKCLAIDSKTLPEKHPDFAITYCNIGDVYRLMARYEKALTYHERAISVQKTVMCSSLQYATTYMNLGETYREMKDYMKAMEYFEKTKQIYQEKLPKNHPDYAQLYHNMSKLQIATRKYSIAMEYVEQAVNIAKEKLPPNHPHLVDYQITLENIQRKL